VDRRLQARRASPRSSPHGEARAISPCRSQAQSLRGIGGRELPVDYRRVSSAKRTQNVEAEISGSDTRVLVEPPAGRQAGFIILDIVLAHRVIALVISSLGSPTRW
jgi:hypothetical protein